MGQGWKRKDVRKERGGEGTQRGDGRKEEGKVRDGKDGK